MYLYRSVLILFVLFSTQFSFAQVEVFRPDKADTATYIAPEDTITRAPLFGNAPEDLYRYLEVRYNMSVYGRNLNYYQDNVRFSFYVERNGRVTEFKVLNTTNVIISGEIQRIINNMPDWKPGKQDGKRRKTLMIYDLNVQMVNELPGIRISNNSLQTEFSNRHKTLKWFLLSGSVLIMVALWITKGS